MYQSMTRKIFYLQFVWLHIRIQNSKISQKIYYIYDTSCHISFGRERVNNLHIVNIKLVPHDARIILTKEHDNVAVCKCFPTYSDTVNNHFCNTEQFLYGTVSPTFWQFRNLQQIKSVLVITASPLRGRSVSDFPSSMRP